jgi:hypothetical protein
MFNKSQITQLMMMGLMVFGFGTLALAKSPTVVVVQSSAEIEVNNTSPFPFDLFFNNERATKIAPNSSMILRVPTGEGLLESRYRGAANIPGQQFSFFLQPNQLRRITLQTPDAELKVSNPNPFRVKLHVQGKATRIMAPNSSIRLKGLRPGNTLVKMTAKNQLKTKTRVFLKPGKGNRWIPTPWTAKLNIHNPNHKIVRVLLDGQFVGMVKPGTTRIFAGISPGVRKVTLDAPGHHMDSTRVMVLNPISISYLQGPKSPKWHKKGFYKKGKKKKVKVVYSQANQGTYYTSYYGY